MARAVGGKWRQSDFSKPLPDDEIVGIAVWKSRQVWMGGHYWFSRETIYQEAWALFLEKRAHWQDLWDPHGESSLGTWLILKLVYEIYEWVRRQPGAGARTQAKRASVYSLEGFQGKENDYSAEWGDTLSILGDPKIDIEEDVIGDEQVVLDFAMQWIEELPGRNGEICRRLILHGEEGRKIAKDYGVTESRISQIKNAELRRLKRVCVARFSLTG